jgi:hypothetical protein
MPKDQLTDQQTTTEMSASWLHPVQPLFRRVQRNHALEHATINLLSRRYPDAQVMGFSGLTGFTLYSTLPADEIISTVRRALEALRSGESELAIHEHCGTNLVVTAMLTTLATVFGLGWFRKSSRLVDLAERLPQAVLLNVIAVMAAKPLGRWFQSRVTTNATLQNVAISSFFTDHRRGMLRVRVNTRQFRESRAATSRPRGSRPEVAAQQQ